MVKSVLITGATGAIGSALAKLYANKGIRLILLGQNQIILDALEEVCTEKGAEVITKAINVRHTEDYLNWLQELVEIEPLDLAIINAGVNTHCQAGNDYLEPWDDVIALVDINILGVMATVHAILPSMIKRQKGHLALMSSLAALIGLPATPSYSASKAAIKAYGEALDGKLCHTPLAMSVIMPGYVSSKMCHAMPGPKPFLWTAEKAAIKIKKALDAKKRRLSFPFPLNLGVFSLSILPPGLSQWFLRLFNYST